jgi:multidrug efflux pump subunit AcrA (membrane-fusion protein)
LVGILTGLALLVGLSVWTAQRISAAESAQEEVAVKRAKDAERVKSQLDAPDRVQAATPAPARWQPRVEFDGTLKAEQAASLSFKVPGKLTRVAVKVGDVVKAGALLATLDSAESAAQLTASAAAIRAAEAQLALAEDTERRTRELVETGALAAAGRVHSEQQKA